jgi:short-subunit dehydrogenase
MPHTLSFLGHRPLRVIGEPEVRLDQRDRHVGNRRGVRVTLLSPGPVNTRFLERATGGARATETTLFHVDAERVAELGWAGFRAGRSHVIPGLANRLVVWIAPLVPRGLLAAMIFRRQSARREGA